MSNRILLVEDELAYARGVIDLLEGEGYTVEHISTGPEGMARAMRGGVDLILLDLMLPGKGGFDICRDLRHSAIEIPIVVLTARGQVIDRVLGLKLGADDYVMKTCDVRELLARVEALLRRARTAAGKTYRSFEFGDFVIEFDRHRVLRNGESVPLSAVEYRLLKYLVEHRGVVVTRAELLEKVWSLDGDTLSRTIDVHMAALRRKLEGDRKHPEYILTIKGFGYKFVS